MKGHRVVLSGSFSGDTKGLYKKLADDGLLALSLIGRELTMQKSLTA